MLDKINRDILLNDILSFLNGDITNYQLDDNLNFKTEDSLIKVISEILSFFFDDTYCHLWVEYYSEIHFSRFIFFLNSNIDFDGVNEKELKTILLSNNELVFLNDKKYSIEPYYPIMKTKLLFKQLQIIPKYLKPFKSLYLKKKLKKMISIINNRNEEIVKSICKKSSLNLFEVELPKELSSDRKGKMLPNDDVIFLLKNENLMLTHFLKNDFSTKSIFEFFVNFKEEN